MKIFIWGCGIRGRRFVQFVGKENVIAFIDSNSSLYGTFISDIPVISFEEYLSKKEQGLLVVTPLHDYEICRKLKKARVYKYTSLNDEPNEITFADESFTFDEIPFLQTLSKQRIAIYGMTYFSLMLKEYLFKYGVNDVEIISHRGPLGDKNGDFDCILVTVPEMEKATHLFPGIRCEDFWDLSVHRPSIWNEELKIFENIHNGEKLFIVATGPSLLFSDLEKLHKAHACTFSMNMVFRACLFLI